MAKVTVSGTGVIQINGTGSMMIGTGSAAPAPSGTIGPYFGFDARVLSTLKKPDGQSVVSHGDEVHQWVATCQPDTVTPVVVLETFYIENTTEKNAVYDTSSQIGGGVLHDGIFKEPSGSYNLPLYNITMFAVIPSFRALSTISDTTHTHTIRLFSTSLFGFVVEVTRQVWDADYNYSMSDTPKMTIMDYWQCGPGSIPIANGPQVIAFQMECDFSTQRTFRWITSESNGVQSDVMTNANPWNIAIADLLPSGSPDCLEVNGNKTMSIGAPWNEIRVYPSVLSPSQMLEVYNSMKSSWSIA